MITIGYDFQGWPIKMMTLEEILKDLGFKENKGSWTISKKNPFLKAYPCLLEDDGMAYGVNPQYITEVGTEIHDDKINMEDVKIFNVFREPLHDIEKDLNYLEKMYGPESEENNNEND